MDLKPITRYAAPRYPTNAYLVEHPELLRLVPKRWRGNKVVLRTLSATIFLVISCQGQAAKVAPVFVHGAGRGTFGCVAINPPVVLSEDEARQVICDEARNAGVEFSDTAFVLGGDPALKADGYDPVHKIAFEYISLRDEEAWWQAHSAGGGMMRASAWGSNVRATADTIRSTMAKTVHGPATGVFYDPLVGNREEWQALTK